MAQESISESFPKNSARGLPQTMKALLLAVATLLAPCPAWSAPLDLYSVPYPFTNDRNETVHLSEWRGKPLILTMEHSNCRFQCSVTFSKLKSIQTLADQKNLKIDFMIISLDPKNDTPGAWRQYRISRGVERSNWHLLTGSEATTRAIADLLGIKYWFMEEHVFHDFKIMRLNANGEIEKTITGYDDEPETFLQ